MVSSCFFFGDAGAGVEQRLSRAGRVTAAPHQECLAAGMRESCCLKETCPIFSARRNCGWGWDSGADGQRWEPRQSMFACLRTGLFLPREHPCGSISRDSLPPGHGSPLQSRDVLFVVIHSGKKITSGGVCAPPVPPRCGGGSTAAVGHAVLRPGAGRQGMATAGSPAAGTRASLACINGVNAPREPAV